MKHLDVVLAARSFRDGRANRTAMFRHRHLINSPIALVFWQLGAEPFSAAAVGFGSTRSDLDLIVAGDPRNRDLAFAALLRVARWFNPRFELAAANRDSVQRGSFSATRSISAPQILVANQTTVEMIGRLGRRLAYLRPDGAQPAPVELIRFGQHLLFLSRHSRIPGQQIVIPLDELVRTHWSTSQSDFERASLAALNAYIDTTGVHGFYAAAEREREAVGPVPDGDDDVTVEPLVTEFNRLRGNSTEPAAIRSLLQPIEQHYSRLVTRTWNLMWECYQREIAFPEAPSVSRRWDADRDAYTRHMDWIAISGRRRTRDTPRQAALLLSQLEESKALLEAEEACDDPLRMIPYLLEGKAVQGQVVSLDPEHREPGPRRVVRRPLVTILSQDPCFMPVGKQLWWTRSAAGQSYEIHQVSSGPDGQATVTLKLSTSTRGILMPGLGEHACFSIHTTSSPWRINLPEGEPWTHHPSVPPVAPAPLEESEA
jgi:hypothetical protein